MTDPNYREADGTVRVPVMTASMPYTGLGVRGRDLLNAIDQALAYDHGDYRFLQRVEGHNAPVMAWRGWWIVVKVDENGNERDLPLEGAEEEIFKIVTLVAIQLMGENDVITEDIRVATSTEVYRFLRISRHGISSGKRGAPRDWHKALTERLMDMMMPHFVIDPD